MDGLFPQLVDFTDFSIRKRGVSHGIAKNFRIAARQKCAFAEEDNGRRASAYILLLPGMADEPF